MANPTPTNYLFLRLEKCQLYIIYIDIYIKPALILYEKYSLLSVYVGTLLSHDPDNRIMVYPVILI